MALKLVRGIFMGTGGAVILTYGTRKYREQIFKGKEEGAIVHHDKTIAKIPIQSQVPATIQIIHPVGDTEEGKTSIAIVDKQKVFFFTTKPKILEFFTLFFFFFKVQ